MRPDAALGRHRRSTQRWDSAVFGAEMQSALVDMAIEACWRRGWRCHAAAVNDTHVHMVVSWREEVDAVHVQNTLKRVLGWRAAKVSGTEGRRWFSDGGIPKRVRDNDHLVYLVHAYLPDQGGVFRKEEGYG